MFYNALHRTLVKISPDIVSNQDTSHYATECIIQITCLLCLSNILIYTQYTHEHTQSLDKWQTCTAHHQQKSMLLKVTRFNITQDSKCWPCNIYATSSYEKQQFWNYGLNLIGFQMYKHQPITKGLHYT